MAKWNIGAYIRISNEVGEKKEYNTLENQKMLINNYLDDFKNYKIVDYFIDDGYTGTDFDRPEFTRMMKMIYEKKINMVIVKDLSRVGRNYIKLGEYLGEIFPRYNIRFISINDNIDSFNNIYYFDELLFQLKNIFHEQYARDTSIKIKKSKELSRKRGDFVGVSAPYGYLKDPKDKHKFIIDDYASKIVKKIFDMVLDGKNTNQICDYLNKKGILPPSAYKSNVTKVTSDNTIKASTWKPKMIISIIHNESYLGTLVQGKHARENFKTHKFIETDKSNWVEIKDHHKAIIDSKTFNDANNIIRYPSTAMRSDEYFLPYLRCGECDGNFVMVKGKSNEYYYCKNYIRKKMCSKNYVTKVILEDMILTKLKEKYNDDDLKLTKDLINQNIKAIYLYKNGKLDLEFIEK